MELILKAAKDAVDHAKSMISYYEKQVAEKQQYLEDAKVKYEQIEKEYQELLEVVRPVPADDELDEIF